MRRLPLVVLASLLAVLAPAAASPASDAVVYAHRGGAGYAPENTLGAFEKTWSLYGDRGVWLELDTQLAGDGVLVVIHDETVDRTTDCAGAVRSMTSAALAACDASQAFAGWGAFEPVPTLRAVLEEGAAGGWRLMVELKNIPGEDNFDATGVEAADALVADVAAAGFPADRLLVQSFFPTSLDRIEQVAPAIGTVLLTTSTLPGAPKNAGFYASENAAFAAVRGYEVSAPDHTAPDLSAESVAAAHALGRLVVPWTVDDAAGMDRLRSFGVDGIITNRPDIAFS